MNATQLYKENKTEGKKSPGSWLQLKDTKWLIEKLECETPKKSKDGLWIFNDVLYEEYKRYLLLKEETNQTEDKTDMPKVKEIKKDWLDSCREEFLSSLNEEITQYIDQKFIERATGQTPLVLKKMGVEDLWKDASKNLKMCYSSVMCAALAEFIQYNKRVDTHRLDLFLGEMRHMMQMHLSLSDGVMFENEKYQIVYNQRRRLVGIEKV